MSKVKLFVFLFFLLVILLGSNSLLQTNAEEPQPNLDIDTLPKDYFISIGNLKPGDNILANIKVLNKGSLDFSYNTYAEFTSGSKDLFEKLNLEVFDQNGKMLFSGRLLDFKSLEKSRSLLFFNSEVLTFNFKMPDDLGNEFQGIGTNLKIIFSAEGDVKGENTLPNTATNTFNYILIGIGLLVGGVFLIHFRKKRENID